MNKSTILIVLFLLFLLFIHCESKSNYPDYIIKFYKKRGFTEDKIFHEGRMTYTTKGFNKYRNLRIWPNWKPSSDDDECSASFGTYWWMYIVMYILGFFCGVIIPILLRYFSVYQLLL